VPPPTPTRDRNVYLVGAGVSCALGLPNTAELLDGVLKLAEHDPRFGKAENLSARLRRAFEYFYPDAVHEGYRPDVVDFFSALRTYLDVGAGLPGGFADAPHLYRTLKHAIGRLLMIKTRDANSRLRSGHPFLDEMVQPGNIIVTSNWDLLIERYAGIKNVPLRLTGLDDSEVVLLKLHGSSDWCLGQHLAPSRPTSDYAMLSERLNGPRPYRPSLPSPKQRDDVPIRIRALEDWNRAWARIRSRSHELHMVTMARGKAGDLGPLRQVWRDAYGAVSRAKRLEIVGYSMPPDDIEIRTLLRAGVQRGADLQKVVVNNPAPEVHERVRRYLDRGVRSNYRGVPND